MNSSSAIRPWSLSDDNQDNDELSIAGWIYADLLLALRVIALGAASFIVTGNNLPTPPEEPTTATSTTTTTLEVQSANLSCDEMVFRFTDSQLKNPTELGERFDREVLQHAENRVLRSAKVGIMLIYGGYDSQQESAKDGKSRADEAVSLIRRISPQVSNVETRTGGATNISDSNQQLTIGGPGDFAIVVYLIYDGDPARSGC